MKAKKSTDHLIYFFEGVVEVGGEVARTIFWGMRFFSLSVVNDILDKQKRVRLQDLDK